MTQVTTTLTPAESVGLTLYSVPDFFLDFKNLRDL